MLGRTVIFLGAGASKALGLPLTDEIFPQLLARLPMGEATVSSEGETLFAGDAKDQGDLRQCLRAILPGLDKVIASSPDRDAWREILPPITDVLSAVDYLLLSASAPELNFTLLQLARARTLLERAIFELLARNESVSDGLRMEGVPDSVHNEWEQTAKLHLLPSRPDERGHELQRIANWIMGLRSKPKDHVTIISTNYDIEVEQALYTRLGYHIFDRVDFGTRVRDPDSGTVFRRPAKPDLDIFKLHGSLNWLRCDLCDNIYVNPVGAVAYLSFLLGDDAARRKRKDPWLEELERSGANQCHCGHRPLRHVIVAPSLVRDVRDPILLEIWRNALESLRQADEWVIVGYSLPPEDLAIRSMLLRAYRGRTRPPAVVAVQSGDSARARYLLLFPNHTYVSGGLASYP